VKESTTMAAPKKLTPLATAIIGGVTGVVCLLLPSAAAALGSPLLDATRQALELGGLAALLGSVAGARFIPTTKDEKTP
jgi:hypothetical protein